MTVLFVFTFWARGPQYLVACFKLTVGGPPNAGREGAAYALLKSVISRDVGPAKEPGRDTGSLSWTAVILSCSVFAYSTRKPFHLGTTHPAGGPRMTTEVRSTTTRGHTKARESTTQKATQIFGTPVHLWMTPTWPGLF